MEVMDQKDEIETLNVSTEQENLEPGQSEGVTVSALQSDELMIENLTKGFSAELLPQLQQLRAQTEEITKNQAVLMETMQQENKKFSANKEIEEFTKMISVVQLYYTKLRNVKSEMDQLDERLLKLKKRSLKLKDRRMKQDLDRKEKRERELALERELTAKPAT